MDHGPSPGCAACSEGLDNHTLACRQRFGELIWKTKFEVPVGIPRDRDSWKLEGNKLNRYHCVKRKRLFAPTKTYELPIPRARIGRRVTQIQFFDGGEVETIPAEEWRGTPKLFEAFGQEFQPSTSSRKAMLFLQKCMMCGVTFPVAEPKFCINKICLAMGSLLNAVVIQTLALGMCQNK